MEEKENKEPMYNMCEIFESIQGEGPQIGMPAIFIRLAGCNLSCAWCDSKYAFNGTLTTMKEILTQTRLSKCKNVIVTGGEPLIQEIRPLIVELLKQEKKVYVETNGTIFSEHLIGLATFIVSPKTQFLKAIPSYMQTLFRWSAHATFKFVIQDEADYAEAKKLLRYVKTNNPVYFMPEAIDEKVMKERLLWLVDKIRGEELDVRVTPRLHIYLWGMKRGV